MSRLLVRLLLLAALLTGLLLLLLPPDPDAARPLLPWQVQADGRGGSTVFGIELGVTPLARAAAGLGGEPKLTLFRRPDGTLVLEAFLDDLQPRGLKADFVLVLELPAAELEALYARGLRTQRGTAGVRRVQLDPVDLPRARAAAVASVTYLPRTDLDAAVLERRFGPPARRVREAAEAVTHWLYPQLGLDIAVREEGREVLQYVAPREFARLTAPLPAG
ncbi:MAG TPA: hypothetical protein VIX81_08375 [Gammaproteobacteria bacterium]